jgi:hypothetical protein
MQKVQKTFQVRIEDFTPCPVGFEGAQESGDAGGRFARLGHGGMNKNHARLRRKAQRLTCQLIRHSTACDLRHHFFEEILFMQSHSQSAPL